MKYKIGDKVKVRKDLSIGKCGKEYVVREMLSRRGETAVIIAELDNCYFISGDATLWHWTDEMLEPVSDEKIVITSDGVTTIARKYDGKKLVREAKAVCSKDDTFNFDVGAKLAMDRLAEDKSKYYNGKVVCVDPHGSTFHTKGKIYQFKDGLAFSDEMVPVILGKVRNFEELQRLSIATWLEVVE